MEEAGMLAAESMLKAISTDDQVEDRNNDHDFGIVLEAFGGDTIHQHKLRYSDGKEENFSFDI